MMWMHARRAAQMHGMLLRQRMRLAAVLKVAAGEQHACNAGLDRVQQHRVAVLIEAVMGQVEANVEKRRGMHVITER